MANSAHIESSIETLFRFDAATVEEVYGSVAGVSHGVKVLLQHLNDRGSRDIEITKEPLNKSGCSRLRFRIFQGKVLSDCNSYSIAMA